MPPAIYVVAGAILAWDGLRDHLAKADVAVIPGNGALPNGVPAPVLQARLDRTIELFWMGLFAEVFVSGSVEKGEVDEARTMHDYLVDHGIPEARIHMDHAGDDTYETARHAAQYMREHGLRSAIVVSQYYHLPRPKLALRHFGIRPVYGAHTADMARKDLRCVAREVFGCAYFGLRTCPPGPAESEVATPS